MITVVAQEPAGEDSTDKASARYRAWALAGGQAHAFAGSSLYCAECGCLAGSVHHGALRFAQ
jgi:hypothetical protein